MIKVCVCVFLSSNCNVLVLQSTCHFVSTRCLSYWCGGCTRFRGVDVLLLIVQFSVCDVRVNVLNNVVVSVRAHCVQVYHRL